MTAAPAGTTAPSVPEQRGRVPSPRLARHTITLADGHRVGLSVCGRGVPLVVVHGFSAEGFLYAQSLSRLVSMGFKVIAIDTAGHGSTRGLPLTGANMYTYAELLGRAVEELGIGPAIYAGHSMGGRMVVELLGHQPDKGIGAILIDAIVGDEWDRMVNIARFAPALVVPIGVGLVVDSITTLPITEDLEQSRKLLRLLIPTYASHLLRPWRLAAPAVSILRSRGSKWMLERLRERGIPTIVMHGDRDFVVPLATARSAAKRSGGVLYTVGGGFHSWILKDPETMPAVIADALQGRLGEAYRQAIAKAGLDPAVATLSDIEGALYAPDAWIRRLTPPLEFEATDKPRFRPRYRWQQEDYGDGSDAG